MPQLSDGSHGRFGKAFEDISDAEKLEDAIFAVANNYQEIGHITVHLANVIHGPIDAPFVRSTYPAAWIARYVLRSYIEVDPIIKRGFSTKLPFSWTEVEFDDAAAVLLEDAKAFGINTTGYTVPVIDKAGRRSIFSITPGGPEPEWKQFIQSNLEPLCELAHAFHRKAVIEAGFEQFPETKLYPREVECLSLTAQGKDAATIALILELTEHTVRAYLKSARHKLNSATISQAVAKAIKLRILS